MRTHAATDDITVLASAAELPGLGHLPVNGFVLHAQQPTLVDTGMPADRTEFLDLLWAAVDPADLRWVWITHPDRDHTGALMQVLEAAPQARVVTNFLGFGILGLEYPITPDRVYLLNPGQSLDIGDRTLHAFRPPLYDSPATAGFVDSRSGAVFTSDCFGGPVAEHALAVGDDAGSVAADELAAAQRLWATADSPWVTSVDRVRYGDELRRLAGSGLDLVLSTHLPPAHDMGAQLLDTIATAPDAAPFVGPDQAALQAMLAGFAPPDTADRMIDA